VTLAGLASAVVEGWSSHSGRDVGHGAVRIRRHLRLDVLRLAHLLVEGLDHLSRRKLISAAIDHLFVALHIDVVLALRLRVRDVHSYVLALPFLFSKVFFAESIARDEGALGRRQLVDGVDARLTILRLCKKTVAAFLRGVEFDRRHLSSCGEFLQASVDDR